MGFNVEVAVSTDQGFCASIAGMDFHELLEIPQGDRRQYHDDVSIIVISLEGQIWRSCL